MRYKELDGGTTHTSKDKDLCSVKIKLGCRWALLGFSSHCPRLASITFCDSSSVSSV